MIECGNLAVLRGCWLAVMERSQDLFYECLGREREPSAFSGQYKDFTHWRCCLELSSRLLNQLHDETVDIYENETPKCMYYQTLPATFQAAASQAIYLSRRPKTDFGRCWPPCMPWPIGGGCWGQSFKPVSSVYRIKIKINPSYTELTLDWFVFYSVTKLTVSVGIDLWTLSMWQRICIFYNWGLQEIRHKRRQGIEN